jgi:hypothetical protein
MSMSKRLQIIVSDKEAERLRATAERAGLSLSEWARRALVREEQREGGPDSSRMLAALDRALTLGHPTADIDQMLREVEAGRALR